MTSGMRRRGLEAPTMAHARRRMAERCGTGNVADMCPAPDRRDRSGTVQRVAGDRLAGRLPFVRRGPRPLSRSWRPPLPAWLLRPARARCSPDRHGAGSGDAASPGPATHELDPRSARHHCRRAALPGSSARSGCPRRRARDAAAGVDLVDRRSARADQHCAPRRCRLSMGGGADLWVHHGRRSCCLRRPARSSCSSEAMARDSNWPR